MVLLRNIAFVTLTTGLVVVNGQTISSSEVSDISSTEKTTANYECLFETLWDGDKQPVDYPGDDVARYSTIVLASHSSDYEMWSRDKYASDAMVDLAQDGDDMPLVTEILTNKIPGQQTVYDSSLLTIIDSLESSFQFTFSTPFKINKDFPLMSSAYKLIPSPDWFGGMYNINMIDEETENWLSSITINSYPMDAGTQNGQTFLSGPDPTDPVSVIHQQTFKKNNATGIFVNANGKNVPPVAKYICTMITDPSDDADATPTVSPAEVDNTPTVSPANVEATTAPVPSPVNDGNEEPSEPIILLPPDDKFLLNEDIRTYETSTGPVYLQQFTNGECTLFRGTPNNPVYVIWSNDVNEAIGEYYTHQGGDGNLLTKVGNPDNKGTTVFTSKTSQGSGTNDFYFTLNNLQETTSIYKGDPTSESEDSIVIWTSDRLTSDSPTASNGEDNSSPPTASPTTMSPTTTSPTTMSPTTASPTTMSPTIGATQEDQQTCTVVLNNGTSIIVNEGPFQHPDYCNNNCQCSVNSPTPSERIKCPYCVHTTDTDVIGDAPETICLAEDDEAVVIPSLGLCTCDVTNFIGMLNCNTIQPTLMPSTKATTSSPTTTTAAPVAVPTPPTTEATNSKDVISTTLLSMKTGNNGLLDETEQALYIDVQESILAIETGMDKYHILASITNQVNQEGTGNNPPNVDVKPVDNGQERKHRRKAEEEDTVLIVTTKTTFINPPETLDLNLAVTNALNSELFVTGLQSNGINVNDAITTVDFPQPGSSNAPTPLQEEPTMSPSTISPTTSSSIAIISKGVHNGLIVTIALAIASVLVA